MARATLTGCAVFGLWDRLGDDRPATPAALLDRPPLEAAGVDDWQRQVLDQLVPLESACFVCLSTATWKVAGLSGAREPGRSAWAAGLRRQHGRGNTVFVSLPPRFAVARAEVFSALGYNDEWLPEIVLLPRGAMEQWDTAALRRWCTRRELWCNPARIIPGTARAGFAFFNGWLYIAVEPGAAPAVEAGLEVLADRWGVQLGDGLAEYAWLC